MNEETGAILFGVAILLVLGGLAAGHALYINDIPRIHNGHIIYVSQRYSKLNNFEWTDVEILTYSGDSHHVQFWGHPEFELNTNYHIHTVFRCRFLLLPFPRFKRLELITDMEIIGS